MDFSLLILNSEKINTVDNLSKTFVKRLEILKKW